jgi:hypothetical protein
LFFDPADGPRPRAKVAAHWAGVFGLSHGEIGLVTFIVVAILSAKYWPRMGEWVARRLTREDGGEH